MTARRLLSISLTGSLLLAGCSTMPTAEQINARHTECLAQSPNSQYWTEYCTQQRATALNDATDASCTSELFQPWERMCTGAKAKMLLLAFLGGAARGAANSASRYGYADHGRYKGYKTYDNTFISRYGTTRCRTQIGDGKSYTSCD